jgi:hypothetical protein
MGYKNLKDAAEVTGDDRYGDGRTMVWYQKPGMSRDFGMGWKFLQKHDLPTPDPKNLQKTHVFLGFVDEKNLDKVFHMMQGMFWSPRGEANSFIRSKKLDHTSMMVGDVIQIGSTMYFVDRLGFEKLADRGKRASLRKKVIRLAHEHPELRKDLLPLVAK